MSLASPYRWLGLLPVVATFALVQCHPGDAPPAPTARRGAMVERPTAADLIDAGFLP